MLTLHMCSGRPVRGRLHARELVGRLRAVAQRQLGLRVEVAGLLHHLDQLLDGNLPQDVAGALGVAHVALDQAAVGLADLGHGLAGGEVDDLVDFRGSRTARPSGGREC